MTDTDIQSARADLAFLRAVAEDSDPLPALYGAHLFAIGACFGPALLVTWAAYADVGGIPESWAKWTSLPASVIYVPILIAILRSGAHRGRGGPGQSAIWFVWAAAALMIFTLLIGAMGASARVDSILMTMWPPSLLALYGGAWALTGFVRRARWHGLVAAGACLASIACAWAAATPAQWLVLGIGVLAFMAAPGLAIMLAARRRA